MFTNDMNEGQGSLDRDDEDVYFDDESAEVVLSSSRLGDDQESSLFTNSNWFALEDSTTNSDRLTGALASVSPRSEGVVGDKVDKAEDELDTEMSSAVPLLMIQSQWMILLKELIWVILHKQMISPRSGLNGEKQTEIVKSNQNLKLMIVQPSHLLPLMRA